MFASVTSSPMNGTSAHDRNGSRPKAAVVEVLGEVVKGKGKGRAMEQMTPQPVTSGRTPLRLKLNAPGKATQADMPPPPVPEAKVLGGRGGRRATLDPSSAVSSISMEDEPPDKARKRARMSLPEITVAKALRDPQASAVETTSSPSSAVQPPSDGPESLPVPTPLLSLAHLRFLPPPIRPRERSTGPRRFFYTDPSQRPPSHPPRSGDIARIMSSYIHIEDTGPSPEITALELRAAREAYFRNRVNYLQQQGRLARLLDDTESEPKSASKSHQKAVAPPSRKEDHQDALLSHMVQVRTAMLSEAKIKPQVCKRVARMVQAHWDNQEGKEERERAAEEKERRRKARDLGRAMRKRWGLAVKVSSR